MSSLKLNLGCGSQMLPGWCNVDLYGAPDVRWDLEQFPWPWADGSVDEVLLSHTLEHLGQTPALFIGVMKELYRICRHGAAIRIVVPHPRHNFFLLDPTHVRPILPQTLEMFSRKVNLQWQAEGIANTPLALHHGVDFDLTESRSRLDEPFHTMFREGRISAEKLDQMERTMNNIVAQIEMTLTVVKDGP
ncbi:MAG: hypothetical protein BGN82_00860 [Alphaproteobacteria bacterium 65-7]|nr:MAG: hypothetical protein BGN82_00860 [Alphaproteobacteria bacterium 65-7]